MYVLNPKDKKFLRDFSTSPDGAKMKKLLEAIARSADSVTGIVAGDYGAQVEGRKIAKTVLEAIANEMVAPAGGFGSAQDGVDEEWA